MFLRWWWYHGWQYICLALAWPGMAAACNLTLYREFPRIPRMDATVWWPWCPSVAGPPPAQTPQPVSRPDPSNWGRFCDNFAHFGANFCDFTANWASAGFHGNGESCKSEITFWWRLSTVSIQVLSFKVCIYLDILGFFTLIGEFVVGRFLDFYAIQFCLIIVRMKSNKFFSWKKTNHRYSTNYHQLIEIFWLPTNF